MNQVKLNIFIEFAFREVVEKLFLLLYRSPFRMKIPGNNQNSGCAENIISALYYIISSNNRAWVFLCIGTGRPRRYWSSTPERKTSPRIGVDVIRRKLAQIEILVIFKAPSHFWKMSWRFSYLRPGVLSINSIPIIHCTGTYITHQIFFIPPTPSFAMMRIVFNWKCCSCPQHLCIRKDSTTADIFQIDSANVI